MASDTEKKKENLPSGDALSQDARRRKRACAAPSASRATGWRFYMPQSARFALVLNHASALLHDSSFFSLFSLFSLFSPLLSSSFCSLHSFLVLAFSSFIPSSCSALPHRRALHYSGVSRLALSPAETRLITSSLWRRCPPLYASGTSHDL